MGLKTLKANIGTNVKTRIETFKDKKHLVVPATILVEGVHNGLLYTSDELSKFVDAWNGIPIPVLHPENSYGDFVPANNPDIIDDVVVGTWFNTYFEDGKLKGEAWLDIDKTKEVAPEVLDIIHIPSNILEVSTGLFLEEIGEGGIWNDEEYFAEAINYRPEHLALLPGRIGACSADDGCGIRDNQKGGNKIMPTKEEQHLTDLIEKKKTLKPKRHSILNAIKKLGLITQEISHDEIHYELQEIVNEWDRPATEEQSITQGKWHFVREVFDNYFVYSVYEGDSKEKLFKQNFIIADNDKVELDGNAVEVRLKTEYVALSENGKQAGNAKIYEELELNKDEIQNLDKEEKDNMCCEKKVQALIDNEATRFTADDKDWLMKMEEDQLDAMFPIEVTDNEETEDNTEVTDNEETTEVAENEEVKEEVAENEEVKEETEEEATEEVTDNEEATEEETEEVIVDNSNLTVTIEEYISNAPMAIKDALLESVKVNEQKRNALIDNILKIKTNKFTEKELKTMRTSVLENIASLVGESEAKPDYSVNGVKGKDINEEKKNVTRVIEAPVMKWNKDMTPDYSHLED